MTEYIEKRNNYLTTVIKKINKNIESLKKISNLNESFNELNIQNGGKLTEEDMKRYRDEAKQKKAAVIVDTFDARGKTQVLTTSIVQLENATQERINALTDQLYKSIAELQGTVQALDEQILAVNASGEGIVRNVLDAQQEALANIERME